jgi:glutamate synthase (NADPH/NADH) small chain
MAKNLVKPKELPVELRTKNFDEVVSGYTEEEMLEESSRCIQCKNPRCISGCPVGIDIKKFIYQLIQKDYKGAFETIYEKNRFPSICGRVCPAEYQCRKFCVFTPKTLSYASENAINIPLLERFVGDYARKHNLILNLQQTNKKTNLKVACIGSGPASITVAGELARYGIEVDVFEALHTLGGVLSYGIPTFRLPRDVLNYEINLLTNYGVKFYTGVIVGRTISFYELKKTYDTIFIGTGAGAPTWLNIKGENLINIYSANEYLTRVNLMHADKFPQYHTPVNVGKNIVVIGGGNTAMDAARVALRIQKINLITDGKVTVLYRRTELEMPARKVEIEHAKEEGVEFQFLVQPIEFIGDKEGKVVGVKCLKCELGEPDESGRRRPVPIEGSEFIIDTDLVIVAIGLKANQTLSDTVPELKTTKWGDIIVNPETMQTSIENVYAGGDIVGGEGTIIEAMGMGKKAASAILKKFGLI